MNLVVLPYQEQVHNWPRRGRHILAQFDDKSIVVYQAYKPAIGHFAAANGYLGGEYHYRRMSWIKTNFLWMMHRSGWGTKSAQEVVLAIRLTRAYFDSLLEQAVHAVYEERPKNPPASGVGYKDAATIVAEQWRQQILDNKLQ